MSSFSQRHGYNPPSELDPRLREDVPYSLRRLVHDSAKRWNIERTVLRNLTWRILKADTGQEEQHLWAVFHNRLMDAPWFKVYEVIESLYAAFKEDDLQADEIPVYKVVEPYPKAPGFEQDINEHLIHDGIPWQIVNGEIVARGHEGLQEAVKVAISDLQDNQRPTAASHIKSAFRALSERPNANTSGAVSHSTSALECVLHDITGEALKLSDHLKKHFSRHSSLRKALEGVYGYACDAGARHGKEGIEPALEEAQFVVTTCAAACRLLTAENPNQGVKP